MSGDPGFTPAPDCIRDDIDPMAALVFGSVWRWCQMRRGQCEVDLDAICQRTGYRPTAVRIRLRALVSRGWLVAEERDGRPTVYRDAGRWQLRAIGIDMAAATPTPDGPPREALALTPTRGGGGATPDGGVPQRETLATPTRGGGPLKRQEKKEPKTQEKDTNPAALAADAAAQGEVSESFTAQVSPALVQATGFRGTVAGGKTSSWLGQCLGILGEATGDDPTAALDLLQRIRTSKRWQYRKRSTAQFPDWLRSMVADLATTASLTATSDWGWGT